MEFFQGSYMPMKLIRLFWYVGQTLDVLDPLFRVTPLVPHPPEPSSHIRVLAPKNQYRPRVQRLHGLSILCISSRRTDSRTKGGKQEPKWSYLYIGESGGVKKLQYVR